MRDLEHTLNRGLAFRSRIISLPAGLAPSPAISRIPTKQEVPVLTPSPQADAQTDPSTDTTEEAITRISTFKRKKIKVRKDRERTVRRKIRRKSHKKRAKFKL